MFAIYEIDTGNLVSTGTVVADPLPSGLAVKPANIWPGVWNQNTLQFDPLPPLPRMLDKTEFLRRFTAIERKAIQAGAKTDPNIEDFMFLFSTGESSINLDSDELIEALNYFVGQGLLIANRPAELRV